MGSVPFYQRCMAETRRITVDLTEEMASKLDAEAARMGVSRSIVVRKLLKHGLKLCSSECPQCARERGLQ